MENNDAENAALMQEIERTIPPMNLTDAEKLLLEAKQIFDDHGVVFFLRQGTCLGAVRDPIPIVTMITIAEPRRTPTAPVFEMPLVA